MPNVIRTATPNGVWHSFGFTCVVSAGIKGVKNAWGSGISWLHMIEDSIGAVLEDVVFGGRGVLIYYAEKIDVPKKTGSSESFSVGQKVYWDPVDGFVSPNWASGRYMVGIATEPATAAATIVEINLFGAAAKAEL